MPTVPLFGSGTFGKSANATIQRRINVYAEPQPDADGAEVVYYPRPGLLKGFNDDNSVSSFPGGAIRGLTVINSLSGTVSSESVYIAQGASTGYATYPGRFLDSSDYMQTTSGPVQFAYNGTQTVSVDGSTAYFVPNATTMADEGVTTFPDGAKSICFLGGYFIVEDPAEVGQFRWSGLYDGLSWPALNFATAESCPDPLMHVYERGGELLLFGSRTLEFWQLTGNTDVFARVGGSGIDWGLAQFDTIRKANQSVLFLGRNLGGQPQVCQLDGYSVSVVSTPDVDKRINDEIQAGVAASACVVTFSGHTWYVLNMAETSHAYDLTTGIWSEWQTEGARWAGQYSSQYRNTSIISDYRDGRVYYLDDDRYLDDAAPIMREITTRHIASDADRITLWEVALDVESGVGLESGQGSDPQIMLQVSRDGGHTFGNELWQSLGALGEYTKRVIWRRLGRARNLVLRFRVTDPVKTVFLGASVRLEK